MVRAGSNSTPEFFSFIDKPKRNNGAGNGGTHVGPHNNRYGAVDGNGTGSYQGYHQAGGRGTALQHGGNQQPDKQPGKRVGGGQEDCFRSGLSQVLQG